MARTKISKRTVDAAVPGAKDVLLWDTELPGFVLKVTPAGRKVYLAHYRNAEGKNKRVTLGTHGVLTPEQAREAAKRLLASVALGEDPAEAKVAARVAGTTLADLWAIYRAEGCATKKPGSLAMDLSRWECHLNPLLGAREVRDITRGDVERTLIAIATGRTATPAREKIAGNMHGTRVVKGGKGAATRSVSLLGAMMTFAVRRDLRLDNPVSGVERYKDRKIVRYLTPDELGRLGEALADIERAGYYPACAPAALRLLALSGCRRNEVMTLEWRAVDLERGMLRLDDSKTGWKAIPLGQPALDLLASLPRVGPFVFPSPEAPTLRPYGGIAKVWVAVRKRAQIPDVRLHDLRHSFASVSVSGGDSLPILGKILGHSSPSTTQRYAHLSASPVKHAVDRAAGTIASALDAAPSSANRRAGRDE